MCLHYCFIVSDFISIFFYTNICFYHGIIKLRSGVIESRNFRGERNKKTFPSPYTFKCCKNSIFSYSHRAPLPMYTLHQEFSITKLYITSALEQNNLPEAKKILCICFELIYFYFSVKQNKFLTSDPFDHLTTHQRCTLR